MAFAAGALAPLLLASAQASPTSAVETSLLSELARAQGAREQSGLPERWNLTPPPLRSDSLHPVSAVAERRSSAALTSAVFRSAPAVIERQALEPLAEAAAQRHGVGVDFFKRLIRQESGYNPYAVSHAGAQGIAQFMPATAAMVGLDDPFDPAKALPKSAEHIADLQRRLGNQGLAAAAYNAGEGRVRAWLAGRSGLPRETQSYVLSITGRQAHEWAPAGVTVGVLAAVSLTGVPALAGPTFTRVQSAEWQLGIKLMGGQSRLTALLNGPGPTGRRTATAARGTQRAQAAAAVTGERALCASMGGCIVAAVY